MNTQSMDFKSKRKTFNKKDKYFLKNCNVHIFKGIFKIIQKQSSYMCVCVRETESFDEFSFSCMKKRFKILYMYVFLWGNLASEEGISHLRGRILAKGKIGH